ncbi:MAG: hypothetical protein RIS64_721 [Bacteroidota bacterium]|jgi:anti-sigma-K factor RskA
MNLREIIESGIIELYVMNGLPPDEAAQLEKMAQLHPEIRMEMDAIESALLRYAQAHAVTPRPELKQIILNNALNQAQPTAEIPKAFPKTNFLNPSLGWILAVTALASSVFLGLKWRDAKQELANCNKGQQSIIAQKQLIINQLESQIHLMRHRETKKIQLKGLKIAPNAQATIFWNPLQKGTLFVVEQLPPPPAGKQYQLWAIVDKKPIDAGLLQADKTDCQTMKPFEKAEAFAVTLEPSGGSIAPTLTEMYLLAAIL